MTNIEILEESVLIAADKVAKDTNDQVTKALVNLFKSAILKKYKDSFDQELTRGEVHRKNVDKAVDFCFEDICVAVRRCSGWNDDEKEELIRVGEMMTGTAKAIVYQILKDKGIRVF